MSRVMRVSVMMMRKAKHDRALDGAASLGRLETGAHTGPTIGVEMRPSRALACNVT